MSSKEPGGDTEASSSAVVPTSTAATNDGSIPPVETDNDTSSIQSLPASTSNESRGGGGFVWNRKSITVLLGLVLLLLIVGIIMVGLALGGVALLTLPLWLPMALLTSPLWLPLLLFTSPVWFTSVLVMGGTVLFCMALTGTTIVFFVWPAEWLPTSPTTAWLLEQRNQATLQLIKWQAKMALYAAGVGPLADAALLISNHVDLVALQKIASELDLQQVADTLKRMDFQEMQEAIVTAVQTVMKGF